MDKRERGGFSPPALGGSSLLVIFAVLALTVFALLSLSTVKADVRLADASVQAIQDYYAADCKAQEILARVRMGDRPEGVEIVGSGVLTVTYAVPISDTQELQVEAVLTGTENGTFAYTVTRWQAVPVGDWQADDGPNVWDGT